MLCVVLSVFSCYVGAPIGLQFVTLVRLRYARCEPLRRNKPVIPCGRYNKGNNRMRIVGKCSVASSVARQRATGSRAAACIMRLPRNSAQHATCDGRSMRLAPRRRR